MGHPGITRLWHFVRSKNLPYFLADVKKTSLDCKTCAEVKPRFFRKQTQTLINATQPWQKISLDFKGPVKGKNKYLLIVIDEFSRFPFVFPCQTMTTETVIKCLTTLFCKFGLPGFILTVLRIFYLKISRITSTTEELSQAAPPRIIQPEIHKMRGGIKPFGEL